MTAGTLDRTFGLLGMTGADFGGADAAANAIAIQSDGKILAAGYSRLGGHSALAVARFYPNGFLDPSFGSAAPGLAPGELRIPLARGTSQAYAIALQTDGKIVVGGSVDVGGGDTIMVIARLLPGGTPDPGFGVGGFVLIEALRNAVVYGLIVTRAGKIIGVGPATVDRWQAFTLVGLNADGTMDAGFGTAGIVRTVIGLPSTLFAPAAYAVIDQTLGIVASGRALIGSGGAGPSLPSFARYKPDGSLDPSFADHGTLSIPGPQAQCIALAVSANRYILGAGNTSETATPEFLLTVLRPLDGRPTLLPGPSVTTSFRDLGFPQAVAQACAVHNDRQTERWLLAGTVTAGAKHNIALARYQYNGSLDPSFAGGRVVTSFLTGPSEGAAMAVQPVDRKIIVAGNADYAGAKMFALVRYLGI